jgi:hypothetical protein
MPQVVKPLPRKLGLVQRREKVLPRHMPMLEGLAVIAGKHKLKLILA